MPQGDSVGRINAFRPKIFLADLEFAKKEELERRRKLRLEQVRQQARDIAAIIRTQTGDAKKRAEEWSKQVQYQSAVKSTENKQKELEEKFSESLSSVGTAHSSATMLSDVDQLLQHRAELQDTLARVRAELAAEKTKDLQKQRTEIVQCPREGISIAKVPNSKLQVRPAIKRILTPILKTESRSQNVPPTPPNFMDENSLSSCRADDEVPEAVEKTIFSPPMLSSSRPTKLTEKPAEVSFRSDGRKSCPPTTESIEVDVSCDSDDSGQTWPPPSVKKKKSSRVRMYDHSAKKCSEYVQQCGVVRLEDPETQDMKELIQEEEDFMSKKTEEELESRQMELQRGLKALREEVAKKDFDNSMKGLCRASKEKRLRKALMYPNVPSGDAPSGLGNRASQSSTSRAAPPVTAQGDFKASEPEHRPPLTIPEDPLSAIVTSLNEKRESILNERSRIEESSDNETVESSEDEESQLPLWLRAEFEAQNNRELVTERVATPKTVMSTLDDDKKERREGSDRESQKESHHEPSSSSITETDDNRSSHSPKNQSTESESPKGLRKRVDFHPDAQSRPSKTEEQTSSSTNGVNVQIKITKGNSPSKGSPLSTPQKSDSSTSYYSPPNTLSPAQVSVLNDILSKVSVKNRNPVLHYYITRVLNMSHQSVSDLDVSTSSDLSIPADLFPRSKQSTPKKIDKKPWCLEETDNLSTVVSVASTPRAPSSSGSSPDYSAQIAHLLKNMMDLQRMRNSHSTAESSDGRSSYKSVPGKMSVEGQWRSGMRNGIEYGEETGIFESSRAEGLPDRPSYIPHFSDENVRIDIPSNLLPKPFQDAGSGLSQEDRLGFIRRIMDVPDGYAMKPEQHPIAVTMTSGDVQKAIDRLSDIESVVSSIQSTPTKKTRRRRTSPTGSLPASDVASVVSDIASSDFISSTEMLNNDLIGSSTSSSDFEDVFRSLGIGWALSTLRRTRNSRNLRADDSSSKTDGSVPTVTSSDKSSNGSTYRHSTPVKTSAVRRESPENGAVPSLTPPNVTLQCPNLLK